MNQRTIHLNAIMAIADALNDLNDQVVFVGGAVLSLYVKDPAAEDVRPTKDVDIVAEIVSLTALESLRQELVSKGFTQTADDDVMCRFRFQDMKVDVMSTKGIGWAPANSWFKPGLKLKETIVIGEQTIHVLPLAYYLASKFEAFHDRGRGEPRTSHDYEDITYLLDNCDYLVEAISQSPTEVVNYLVKEFEKIIQDAGMREALLANLPYGMQSERLSSIMATLSTIVRRAEER